VYFIGVAGPDCGCTGHQLSFYVLYCTTTWLSGISLPDSFKKSLSHSVSDLLPFITLFCLLWTNVLSLVKAWLHTSRILSRLSVLSVAWFEISSLQFIHNSCLTQLFSSFLKTWPKTISTRYVAGDIIFPAFVSVLRETVYPSVLHHITVIHISAYRVVYEVWLVIFRDLWHICSKSCAQQTDLRMWENVWSCDLSENDVMWQQVKVYVEIQGANYKKILRLSYDVIITYDNRKSNLR